MAKKKKVKQPWEKLKHVSETKYFEYKEMSEDELVATLKSQRAYQIELMEKKSKSGTLKEIRSELNEYKKNWADNNPELIEEIEQCKDRIKEIQAERDGNIEDDLEEKKAMEGGFSDSLAGSKEHIDVLLDFLRQKS